MKPQWYIKMHLVKTKQMKNQKLKYSGQKGRKRTK